MGLVLSFTPRVAAGQQRAAGDAAIIIFPGVRYERVGESAQPALPQATTPKH